MPIPSWHRKGAGLFARASLLAAIAVCAGTAAHAHDPGTDPLPGDAGWRLGGAAAIVLPAADDRWPAAAWPGVLIDGNAPRDQRRGLRLEHATLDLAMRLNARWGGQLVVGWHDRESAHLEAASVRGLWPLHDGEIDVALGRDRVRMGPVLEGAGHFDRFSLAPLAQRAVLNGAWIDDGGRVTWRRPEADGLRALSAGLWRGRAFPGGTGGPAFPALHLHVGWGHLDAHLSAARLQVSGRGASARSAGSTGHSHGALDCAASLQQRVCFDGDVEVLGTSVQWEPAHSQWTLALAALARRERGTLYSTSGDALHRTLVRGAWVDATWRPAVPWTVAGRVERLVASNRLEGIGTALLAREAGLTAARPVERVSGALLYQWDDTLQVALEAGHERFSGGRVSHVALRALWRNPRVLGGSW